MVLSPALTGYRGTLDAQVLVSRSCLFSSLILSHPTMTESDAFTQYQGPS
jgi:hypothetical protein